MSPAASTSGTRQNALDALRAAQSALAGGANLAEFKRYHLEAKVKVDALPVSPTNAPLRKTSDMYSDGVTMLIAAQIQEMSGDEFQHLKAKYASDPLAATLFVQFGSNIPDSGFGAQQSRFLRSLAAADAKAIGQGLLELAGQNLTAIK